MKTKSLISPLLLLCLPIAYLISHGFLSHQKGNFWWTVNQDPDYAYLLNSLIVANFEAPGHVDHPGTPMQILGTIVLRVGYFFSSVWATSPTNLTDSVLTNPESYLYWINDTLVVLAALSLLVVGLGSLLLSNHLGLSLLLQTTPFITVRTLAVNEASRVAPEPLLFCISQLLVLLLVAYWYDKTADRSRWFALGIGVIFGLGMATKITFVPMVFFFLLVAGWRGKLLAIVAAIATFLLATFPIIPYYSGVLDWIVTLTTHTGLYGTGERGFVETDSFASHLNNIFVRNQNFIGVFLLFNLLCFLAVAYFWSNRRSFVSPAIANHRNRTLCFLSVVVGLVVWGQILITAVENSSARYLVPSVGLAGFLIFLSLHLLDFLILRRTIFRDRSILITSTIALVLCSAIGINQVDQAFTSIARRSTVYERELAQLDTILTTNSDYQTCGKVMAKRFSSVESALYFGDIWTNARGLKGGAVFAERLNQLYPNTVFYNEPRDDQESYSSYTETVSLERLTTPQRNCVLLLIAPFTGRREKFKPSVKFDVVFEGRTQALYHLKPFS
ncbi:MAG: hypothetical protein HC881_11765 [Leptolyngbyaceae cyanobacterium SL_7_1]|nr:hypothetical protein [Leptolyngbyaceae cyanobacterium SL_7_1]